MFWIIGLCVVVYGVCLPQYLHYKKAGKLALGCAYKSLGTLCAFTMALIAAIRLDPRCYICAGAILLYAAADYLLEFQFMLGAGFFLAGHILSVAFFFSIVPFSVLHIVAMILLLATGSFIFWSWRKQIGKQMPAFIVYGISLVAMCGAAIGCFSSYTAAGILFACGGALFYISDCILLRRILFASSASLDWAVMIAYYASVLLFGIGCLQM